MEASYLARRSFDKRLLSLAGLVAIVLAGVVLRRFLPVLGTAREQGVSSAICPTFQATQPIPEERERLAAAYIDVGGQGFIYAVGGQDASKTVTDTVFYAKVLPHGPIEGWNTRYGSFGGAVLKHPALVSTHGRLYILGGNNGCCSIDSVYQAQPQLGTGDTEWFTTTPLTIPVYLHAAVSLGDRIYVIGGYLVDPSSSISHAISEVFSARILESGALSDWESESSLARLAEDGIWAHAAVAVASQHYQCIYVVGGWRGSLDSGSSHSKVFRSCLQGNGKLGVWEEEPEALSLVPTGATGIFNHSAAIVDDRVFVIGGAVAISQSRESSDMVYIGTIDAASGHLGNWKACTSCLPREQELHGAAVASNGILYVIGGKDRCPIDIVYDAVLFTPLVDFEKLAEPVGSVTYGDTIEYVLKLTNLGVRNLGNLIITDTVQTNVPAVLNFHSLPDKCQVLPYSTDTITCAIPSLGLGGMEQLNFQVTISQPTVTSLLTPDSSEAPVDEGEKDVEADAVTACSRRSTEIVAVSATHQVGQACRSGGLTPDCGADLRLEKSGDPPWTIAGQVLSYTLLVHNAGPSSAQDVTVVDYLPDGTTFVTATLPLSSTSPLSWSLGSILAEDGQEIHLVVQVAPGVSGAITNTAVVESGTWDPNSDNNQDEARMVVVGQADLRIDKVDDPDPIAPGEVLTYTLIVTNEGPSDARDVVVTDTLPAGVCNLDTLPLNCSLNPLVCTWDNMCAGQSKQVQLRVTVCPTSTDVLTNTAVVASSTQDSNATNNEDKERTDVTTQADLHIQKDGDLEKVVPGDELIYTLQVNNYGPSDAHNVVISDTLPTGVTFLSSVLTPTSASDPLTWYLDTVAADDFWTIDMTVTVNSTARGILINTVSVNSDVFDPDLSNNQDEEQTLAPIPVVNKAYVCEDGLWCQESNLVINSSINVYLPIILKVSGGYEPRSSTTSQKGKLW